MTDSLAAAAALEALTQATPSRLAAGAGLEALTQALPIRVLGAVGLEVLVPAVDQVGYAGWGIKL